LRKDYGGWFIENSESIGVLELQKSNFGKYYQLNIKIFFQKVFNESYTKSKDLVKAPMGHVNSGEPLKYKKLFDLDSQIDTRKREKILHELFDKHIVPFMSKAMTAAGVKTLQDKGGLYILPAIKDELNI
jgi:hypothetical protein